MPIYVYEVITGEVDEDGNPEPGQLFEVQQSMNDEPLTHHPCSGLPVRRVITPPNLPGKWTDMHARHTLSDDQIGKSGLTKYVKTDTGKYEKVAGQGPANLSAD